MTQAKGAAARLSYVDEVTRNTTPGSPSMKLLAGAVYGESLGPKIGSIMSKVIRGTRGRNTPRGGKIAVDGSVPFELAPLGLPSLLKHALGTNVTTGAGPSYTHTMKRGALLPGMTIEKGFTDLSQYFVYTGCLIDTMDMNISGGDSLITGNFGIIGMGQSESGSSLGTPSSVAHTPFAQFEAEIEEGGGAVTVLNMGLKYANEIEVVDPIGSRYAASLNEGEGMLDITLTMMFETMGLLDKWLAETATSIQIAATIGSTSITFLAPKAKYFGDSAPKIATPQGIVTELTATCYYDTSEATDLKVTCVNTEATI